MPDQLPTHPEQVRSWVLPQAVVRTAAGPPPTTSVQSKVWLGTWVAVVLSVTVLLVLADAPAIAYSIPLGSLLLVNRCQVELEVGDVTARLGATQSRHDRRPTG